MHETLGPYNRALGHWLPGAVLAEPPARRGPDAILRWTRGRDTVTFVAEHKRHLVTQDVRLVVAQVEQWLTTAEGRNRRGLVLAPYIRNEQAAELRAKGIDYVDLVGNAHLEAPGVFVHVEGKRPDKDQRPPGRLTKGWVRTVLAVLVRPELINGPYRPLAAAADVALGTVTACLKDLGVRGFLRETAARERTIVNLPDLVALWVQTYGDVLRPKLRVRHVQMREPQMRTRWEQLDRVLTPRGVPWALTGADGAAAKNDFFQAAETEIYADPGQLEDPDILKALIAQPAVHHGNLRVIEPPGPLAITRTGDAMHPPTAPLLLIYAELRLRRTEQANEAAEMLLPEFLADAKH